MYLVGHRPADFATLKVSASGTNEWERIKSFGFGPNYSQVVCVDGATNVYVAGWINCSPDPQDPTYRDDRIASYDAQGHERWVSTPGLVDCIGDRVDVRGISIDALGHVTYSFNQYNTAFVTSSYFANGTFRWEYSLDSGLGVTSMIPDAYGNIYLTGISVGSEVKPRHYTFPYGTVKLGNGGAQAWVQYYDTLHVDVFNYAQAIALDSTGNVTVTGESPGVGNDIATVQYSSEGAERWVKRYDGPMHGDDGALALVIGWTGDVYVAGYQRTTSNLVELVIIKYVELQNIQVQSNQTVLLQFLGTPGQSYRFQSTTNFGYWEDLGASIADPLGLYQWLDTNPPVPHKFYRTVTP